MSTGGGKSHGSSSSIYIGSTESAKQKVGTLVIGKNDLAIDKVVPSSQVLPPEITNTDVSVVENSSTDTPLLTIAHGSTDKSIQDAWF
jgi:hypothetical protein